MGAVIATLVDLGWQPQEPTQWADPQGDIWKIDPRRAGVIPLVLAKIRKSCMQLAWTRASEHYCGEGIGTEADLTALQLARKNCLTSGSYKEAGMLVGRQPVVRRWVQV
jgi:hypothetical protein